MLYKQPNQEDTKETLETTNKIENLARVEKGKPQVKYEITIKDTEKDEIVYQKKSYGGVLTTVENLTKFSGAEIEGTFQNVIWGNPLIVRFAIDRLEEYFSKHIDDYIDAMQEAGGVDFSDKEAMKEILRKGYKLKKEKTMETPPEVEHHIDKEEGINKLLEAVNQAKINKDLDFAIVAKGAKAGGATFQIFIDPKLTWEKVTSGVLEAYAINTLNEQGEKIDEENVNNIVLKVVETIKRNITKS